MRNRQNEFLSALKWPALAAALVAGALALLPALNTVPTNVEVQREPEVASRDAMRILRDGHDKVLDQIDRQIAQSEQKAAEDAHAFEQAREEARLAAAREAARKLAEQKFAEQRAAEQRAAEAKRVAEASAAKEIRTPKPRPEPATVTAAAPLDIVPESGALTPKPRGPIETVVATVGDVADEIKNKTVSTVVGIKDWFSAAGDKLLGRDKPAGPAAPASRLSSSVL